MLGSQKVIDELNSITAKAIEANNDIRRLGVEIGKLQSTANLDAELRQRQEEFLRSFEDNVRTIQSLKAEFEKELYDMKLLVSSVQKKVLEKLDEEIKREISGYFEKLRDSLKGSEELQSKVMQVASDLSQARQEIAKFTAIAGQVKKSDFELTKYAQKLADMDSEKLELMAKIDSLERLISKLRRTS